MSLINGDVIPLTGGAYEVEQSLRLNDDDSAYLEWTPSSAGNRQKWTWSAWIKRANIETNETLFSAKTNTAQIWLTGVNGRLRVEQYDGSGGYDFRRDFDGYHRDCTGWYHLVIIYDSAQATEADRIKAYRNGEQLGVNYTYDTMSQNFESEFNNTEPHWLGRLGSFYFDGYMGEVHFIDGQALDASNFGETGDYGEWKPIEYTGTYGTNGFYLPFKQDYAVEGMSTTLYTGDGSTSQYIGGVGFQPDLVWIKSRSSAFFHSLCDSVRGANAVIYSNSTSAERTDGYNGYINSFETDGFTVGVSSSNGTNGSGSTFVAWAWDMGDNTPTGFNAVTYTGDGSSSRDIGNIGFDPDLVWIKQRSGTYSHVIADAVRGDNKFLASNGTGAESTDSTKFRTFNTGGFQVGSHAGVNASGSTYVAWCLNMGGETVSNTDGSITSSVRANPTYGQSIVSYTGNSTAGATIGHGLSSAPDVVIIKSRDEAREWVVYHSSIGETQFLQLDKTDIAATLTNFNDTAPTSSLITLGSRADVNNNTMDYIAYCFHSVSGYSKFGTYDGTDSAGVTVTTGFRPAFVMIKCTNLTENWVLIDSMRSPFNDANDYISPNLGNAESSNSAFDIEFTDTGFVLNGTDDAINGYNGGTGEYIYMAFAGGADSISDYNTDGSTDSRVKANPTYGQSIVSYTGNGTSGATIGHGLSSAPDIVMVKNRDASSSTDVYTSIIGADKWLELTNAVAEQNNTNRWNGTAPTSSVFTVGNGATVNTSGQDYIAYCFHSVSGYSKFGSYIGDASTDGSLSVNVGFEPAFLMVKSVDSATYWIMVDNVRSPNNDDIDNYVKANATDAESNSLLFDFTSTGFSLRANLADINKSGDTFMYMAFADKREYAYWLDQSGNNNDWQSNNLTESDISVDSPTNNFATWNSLSSNSTDTLSEGNCYVNCTNSPSDGTDATFHIPSSGKWYYEIYFADSSESAASLGSKIGIVKEPWSALGNSGSGSANANGYYYIGDGRKENSGTKSSYGSSFFEGDIIGVAVDTTSNDITFYKNGISQGSAYTIASGSYTINVFNSDGGTSNYDFVLNAGQDSSFAGNKTAQGNTDGNEIGDFYYTPPSGYLALCTANLPEPDVIPSEHFNTVLYTGDSTDPHAITGVGFQPDFVWLRPRNLADHHRLNDAVRGVNKTLISNLTNAEYTTSNNFLDSFDSDGFTIGDDDNGWNGSSYNYVAWNWKANGSGVSNSDGDITSTVSANQDAGFSIVTYTGSTDESVGHGLSQAPELIIVKDRDATSNWAVYHQSVQDNTANGFLEFNTSSAVQTGSNPRFYNGTTSQPTSTVFYVNNYSGSSTNNTGNDYIAYCFHSVDGFSKVGTYEGNNSTDGTFVYTGFRPAFVLVKNIDSTEDWWIQDSARDPYNDLNWARLAPSLVNAESNTTTGEDFLSNGFKFRTSNGGWNNGDTFVYIAFAETPSKYSNAR